MYLNVKLELCFYLSVCMMLPPICSLYHKIKSKLKGGGFISKICTIFSLLDKELTSLDLEYSEIEMWIK